MLYWRTERLGHTNPVECPTGLLTSGNIQALDRLHLSVPVAASFLATLTLAVAVSYWIVGLLIFWRTSQEWAGLFFSFDCVLLAASGIFGFSATAHMPWLLQVLTSGILNALNMIGPAFFLVFPTGRFLPRWTWAVLVFFWVSVFPFVPAPVSLVPFLLVVVAQIYRVAAFEATLHQQFKELAEILAKPLEWRFFLPSGAREDLKRRCQFRIIVLKNLHPAFSFIDGYRCSTSASQRFLRWTGSP